MILNGYFSTRLFRAAFAVLLSLLPLPALPAAVSASPEGFGERGVALVIVNADYRHAAPLERVRRDALTLADTLRLLSFTVEIASDLDQEAMTAALKRFSSMFERAGPNALGMLYYAGHGFHAGGSNYLMPVDADFGRRPVEQAAIDVDLLLADLAFANAGQILIMLDVPATSGQFAMPASARPGLAPIDAPIGTLVAFAHEPGPALASPPHDGLYPLALARILPAPGLPIEEVLQKVRLDVAEATDGAQVPWESSALLSPVYLNGKAQPALMPAGLPRAAAGSTHEILLDPRTGDLIAWAKIRHNSDPAAFRAYLSRFPHGVFARQAERRRHALEAAKPSILKANRQKPQMRQLENQPSSAVFAQRRVHVLAAPDPHAPIIASFEGGTRLLAVDQAGWSRIVLPDHAHGYIKTSLLGAAPPVDANNAEPAAAPGLEALRGLWQGAFQCQWNSIGLSLDLRGARTDAEKISAVFTFYPVPGSSAFPPGRFAMAGSYDPADGTLTLRGERWLDRPNGHQLHDLSGRIDAAGQRIVGRIAAAGCTDFSLSRSNPDVSPVVHATSVQ